MPERLTFWLRENTRIEVWRDPTTDPPFFLDTQQKGKLISRYPYTTEVSAREAFEQAVELADDYQSIKEGK